MIPTPPYSAETQPMEDFWDRPRVVTARQSAAALHEQLDVDLPNHDMREDYWLELAVAALGEPTEPVGEPTREALEGMVHQFAYWHDTVGGLSTGGLSALEEAFEVLGWEDPHPVEASRCVWPSGCTKRGSMGTPVAVDDPDYGGQRYVWTCWDHSPEARRRARLAGSGGPTEPTTEDAG